LGSAEVGIIVRAELRSVWSSGCAPIHLGESANAQYIPFAMYVDDLRIVGVAAGVESAGAIPLQFELVKNTQIPSTQSLKFNLQVWIDNPQLSRCMMYRVGL
jgi:hypothetical protein